MKPAKLLRIPLRVLETVVENRTGLDLDLSEIFWTNPESGAASNVALAVSMPDGYSAQILWDPNGPVGTSDLIAVVTSILTARKDVASISVNLTESSRTSSKPPVATPSEPPTESTSGGVVSIEYSDIDPQMELPLEHPE